MICDSCNTRDAVVHLTRKDGHGTTQLHLCEKCAAEHGVGQIRVDKSQHPLGEMLNAVRPENGRETAAVDSVACEFCGSTIRDFQVTGRLGCAHCYDAMSSGLRDLLRRVQGSSYHVGKRYVLPTGEVHGVGVDTIEDLRNRLKTAVAREEFELAAELRDRIRTAQ